MTTDGLKTTQDNPSGEPKETSEEMITLKEAEERTRKATSDVLADTGRARKAAEDATKAASDAITRLKEAEERAYQADRERYKDEPERLSAIEAAHRESVADAKLAEANRKLDEEVALRKAAEATNVEVLRKNRASEIAARLNVDPTLLGDLAMLTDGSVEAIEAKAKLLNPTGDPLPKREPILTNTPISSAPGTGRKPSVEELKASTPFETDKRVKSGEWVL